ncbi:hypothetical protein C0J52_04227 [Blattella germanica]|nr:hypothetical protein C0J52_04227 [Blattella germanica]
MHLECCKGRLKQRIRQNHKTLMRGDPDGMQTQKEFRLHFLERTADSALGIVTAQMCLHSVNHVQIHYPGVMQLDDLLSLIEKCLLFVNYMNKKLILSI